MRSQVSKGFTLIELSLSIAFIAVLSIIMTLIITNSISAYHRGITLNTINTVGMDVVDNMREAVQSSPGTSLAGECEVVYVDNAEDPDNGPLAKCQRTGGKSFALVTKEADVTLKYNDESIGTLPVYGAFCTGEYSYIWNSGYLFNDAEYEVGVGKVSFKYKDTDGVVQPKANFKLIQVGDTHRAVCKAAAGAASGKYWDGNEDSVDGSMEMLNSGTIDLTSCGDEILEICDLIDSESVVDILETSENNLALYDLEVATAADNGEADIMFYAVSFILGTIQGGINIAAESNYCTPPEDYENAAIENFDYCAINKFNFAAQATGGQRQ